MKTCLYCGGNNNDSAKSCVICGRDLHTGERVPGGHSEEIWALPRPESPYVSLLLIAPILAFFLLGLAALLAPSMEWFYDLHLPRFASAGAFGGWMMVLALALAGVMIFRLVRLFEVNKGYYELLREGDEAESRAVNRYKGYLKRVKGFWFLLWLIPVAIFAVVAGIIYSGSFAYSVVFLGIRIALPDIDDPAPYVLLAVLAIVFLVFQMGISMKSTVAYRRHAAGKSSRRMAAAHTGLSAAMDAKEYPQPETPFTYLLLIPSVVVLFLFGLASMLAPSVGYFMGIHLPVFAHPGGIGFSLILVSLALCGVMIIFILKRKVVTEGYYQALKMDENTPFSVPLEKYAHYQKLACEYYGLLWLLPLALFVFLIAFLYVSSEAQVLILLGHYRLILPEVKDPFPFIFLALIASVFLVILLISSLSKTRDFRRADAIVRRHIREQMAASREEEAAREAVEEPVISEEEGGGLWGDYAVETEEQPAEQPAEEPAPVVAEAPATETQPAELSVWDDFGSFLDGNASYEPVATAVTPATEQSGPLKRLYEIDRAVSAEPVATRKAANLHELCEWFMDFAKARGFEPELSSVRSLLAAMATSRVVFIRTCDEASEAFAETLSKFFGANATVVSVRESWRSPKSLLFTGTHDDRTASDALCAMYRSGYDSDSFCTLTLTHAEQAPAKDYLPDMLAYAERPERAPEIRLMEDPAENLPAHTVFCQETANRQSGVYMTVSPNVWCLVVSSDRKSFWAPSAGYATGAALTVSLRGKACEPVSGGDGADLALSAEGFRRMLRGITNVCFLPEEQWKKFDRIENFLHDRAGVRFDNRLMRRLETFSSAYMAVDQDANQILDAMLEAVFLPLIAELDPAALQSIDGSAGICETMALAFGADNIPYCMQALHELGYEA